jgi:hypothetical protein
MTLAGKNGIQSQKRLEKAGTNCKLSFKAERPDWPGVLELQQNQCITA